MKVLQGGRKPPATITTVHGAPRRCARCGTWSEHYRPSVFPSLWVCAPHCKKVSTLPEQLRALDALAHALDQRLDALACPGKGQKVLRLKESDVETIVETMLEAYRWFEALPDACVDGSCDAQSD